MLDQDIVIKIQNSKRAKIKSESYEKDKTYAEMEEKFNLIESKNDEQIAKHIGDHCKELQAMFSPRFYTKTK